MAGIPTPRVTVVQGQARLCCPCGRGFLGQLPVKADLSKTDGTLTVSWYCKSCGQVTTATLSLAAAEWAHEKSPRLQEQCL